MHRSGLMGPRDKMARAWCALAASAAVCGCETAGCGMAHVTDLKLVERNHGFYTTITINGQSAELLFDTGGEENLLSEDAAQRLGLYVRKTGEGGVIGVGGQRDTGEARSHEVRMGVAHGEDMIFATVPGIAYHGDADGILGMNFLYGFDLDLDFWSGQIGLYRAIGGCDTPNVVMTQPLYAVPLAAGTIGDVSPGELSPAVYVSINGRRLRAVIDTGAAHTTIFRDSARRAGLDEAESLGSTSMYGVGPRNIKADVRLSAPVVIGDLTINNMPVFVADQRHPLNADMLLGYDFVTRVHIWISRSSGTVVMQYPPKATPSG